MPMRTIINGREVEISDEQIAEIAEFQRTNVQIAQDIRDAGGVQQTEMNRVQVARQHGGTWRAVKRWLGFGE